MNFLCVVLLLASLPVVDEGLTVFGRVTVDGSTPVADTTVVIEAGPNGVIRALGTSDDGTFRIDGLPAGRYMFWIAKDGYSVDRRELKLNEGTGPLELNVQIQPDGNARLWRVDLADRESFRNATMLLADYKAREALREFQRFVTRYPYLVRAHYNVGLCHVELASKQRDFNRGESATWHEEMARSQFEIVLGRYPDYSPALVALAESYVRSLEMEKAETTYVRLLSLTPDEAEQWYTYAEVLAYLNKLPESEIAFERVLEVDPLYVDAHARIGAIRLVQEDYSEAIRRFEIFLAAAPKSNMAPLTKELLKEALSKAEEMKSPQDRSR